MVVAPGTYTGTVVVSTDKATYTFPLTSKTFNRSEIKSIGLNLGSPNAIRFEIPKLSWNLAVASYNSSSESQVTWANSYVTMTLDKNTSGSNANYYLGGANTSTRFAKNHLLTITPANGVIISSIIFTSTTDGYATTLAGSSWNNAGASVSGDKVTITPINGYSPFYATMGGVSGNTNAEITWYGTAAAAAAAMAGTVLWTEDWTGSTTKGSPDDNATPSANYGNGTTVYNSGSVTYSQSGNNVYVRNENTGGGTAPELMFPSDATWTISGIPTAGASNLRLTYKSNTNKTSVSCSTEGTSISGSSKNYTIATGGADYITLVFAASANSRIDDVLLIIIP